MSSLQNHPSKSQQTTITQFTAQYKPVHTQERYQFRNPASAATPKRGRPKEVDDRQVKKTKIVASSITLESISQQIKEQIGGVSSRIDVVLDKLDRHEARFQTVEEKLNFHNENLVDVGYRLNQIEQAKLNSKMEVSGLLFESNATRQQLKENFTDFLSRLEIEYNSSEIVDVYPTVRKLRSGDKNFLIVTFIHESIKNRVMNEKIQHDKAIKSEPITVYFGNVLTRANHQLLMSARNAVKGKKLARAWSMSGEIFIQITQQAGKIKITDIGHLNFIIDEQARNNDPQNNPSTYSSIVRAPPSTSAAAISSNTRNDDDDDHDDE